MALLIYVNDVILASNDATALGTLKSLLNDQFKLKDLRILKYFLGLQIAHSAMGIYICQSKYALELLHDKDFFGCKPAKYPMEQGLKLSKRTGHLLSDPTSY